MLDFGGIEQMAHDHGSGDWSGTVARENRTGVHQGRSAGKIENAGYFAVPMSWRLRSGEPGLQMVIEALGKGHFATVGQIEAFGEKSAAVSVEDRRRN